MSRSLTSNEVNFLIYRYLQESGFKHSAYNFANETSIHKSQIDGSSIPAGSLISFLQKGVQYMEIETKIRHGLNTEVDYDSPLQLLYPDVDKEKVAPPSRAKATTGRKRVENQHQQENTAASAEPMKKPVYQIPEERVCALLGHTHEVFICSWSPVDTNMLASGSGDSTARIWKVPPGPCHFDPNWDPKPIVLKHTYGTMNKDVTTLDWSPDGSKLATGSYDGIARVWTTNGKLLRELERHKGPIFSLKWNKSGSYLLSGSVDNTAIVWEESTGRVVQQFRYHTDPTLDVDWRTDTFFASCSTDRTICLCEVGNELPVKTLRGHKDEVNAIRWDPTGALLASCSDDYTAKLWSADRDTFIHDFKEHTKEIYTIKWSPKERILATASFDATVKLWDVEVGKCLHTLRKHSDPVYSVSFSPDGRYLASGSFDRCLHVWDVRDGSLVKTFRGKGSIFEVAFNGTGEKIACCFSNSITNEFSVCVVDSPGIAEDGSAANPPSAGSLNFSGVIPPLPASFDMRK